MIDFGRNSQFSQVIVTHIHSSIRFVFWYRFFLPKYSNSDWILLLSVSCFFYLLIFLLHCLFPFDPPLAGRPCNGCDRLPLPCSPLSYSPRKVPLSSVRRSTKAGVRPAAATILPSHTLKILFPSRTIDLEQHPHCCKEKIELSSALAETLQLHLWSVSNKQKKGENQQVLNPTPPIVLVFVFAQFPKIWSLQNGGGKN